MTSSADLSAELVAYDRGELDPETAARVERGLAESPALAAELEEIRSVLSLVRSVGELEPSPTATERLGSALDAALTESHEAAPIHELGGFRARMRRTWDYAQWRYENSRGVRRFVAASIIAHAAALAGVAVMLVQEVQRQPTRFAIAPPPEVEPFLGPKPKEALDEHLPQPIPGEELDLDATARLDPFPFPEPDGVPTTPPLVQPIKGVSPDLRFPTVGLMIRFRAVFDEAERERQLRAHAGDLGPWVAESVARGLDWLAERQLDDGSWGPDAASPVEIRAGVTAVAVLAYTSDGRSALKGDDAQVLGPAVRRLESWLTDDLSAPGATKPLYAYSLTVQALAQQYGTDFRHMSRKQRAARKALLKGAAEKLLAWQSESGGFGYRPEDPRTDASCTLHATAALSELRLVGIMETADAMSRAGRYLARLRDADTGRQDYERAGDRKADLALTAGSLALGRELGHARDEAATRAALDAVQAHVESLDRADALLLYAGTSALRRHGRSLRAPLTALRSGQTKDGSWAAAADRHVRQGGDELATALGVLSLTRAYVAY